MPTNSVNHQNKMSKHNVIFDDLAKRGKITSEGKDWITLALDPYHDFERSICGYPDVNSSRSVVKCVTVQHALSRPASIPSTSNWSCNIFTGPVMAAPRPGSVYLNVPCLSFPVNTLAQNMIEIGSPDYAVQPPVNFDLLNIWCAEENVAIPGDNLAQLDRAMCLSATNDISGSFRLIGCGFEVTNTTSSLHAQGSVTVYRDSWNANTDNFSTSDTLAGLVDYNNTFTMTEYTGVPDTAAIALRIPGSKQWNATEGVYAVASFASTDNPARFATREPVSISTRADLGPTRMWSNCAHVTANSTGGTVPFRRATIGVGNETLESNMNCSGAFFTGLSPETTLTVTLKAYVEIYPLPYESLIDLATPSAPYDVKVLSLYAAIIRELPPGVPKGDNDAGDFFRGIGRIALRLIQHGSDFVGLYQPELAPIALIAGRAAKLAADKLEHRVIKSRIQEAEKKKVKAPVAAPRNKAKKV